MMAAMTDTVVPRPSNYRLGRPLARTTGSDLYAHTPPAASQTWHSWAEHSLGVAQLAQEFAEPFGAGALCRLAGLLHDAGKTVADVQDALVRCAAHPGQKLGVPHKVEGAALAGLLTEDRSPTAMLTLVLMLLGHHSGIPDMQGRGTPLSAADVRDQIAKHADSLGELQLKVEHELGVDLQALAAEVELPSYVADPHRASPYDIELFTRMCHSALVDADFLDTAAHFGQYPHPWANPDVGIETVLDRFRVGYASRFRDAEDSATTRLRRHLFAAALDAGRTPRPSGIFRMAAPTGSGKTLAAMAFALEHAHANGKRRVIMAVPFTSITTQNAQVLREVLDDVDARLVLEHHSAIDDQTADDWWRRLGAQNWDAEVIVTTTVQLFDSLFSNRPSATRKLHRLVNSVVVIDEVQALPVLLVPSLLRMLRELVEHYGVTVLLASATQPSFWSLRVWSDLPVIDIYEPTHRDDTDARVTFDIRTASQPWPAIAAEIAEQPQALAIVNTTKDSRALFDALNGLGTAGVVHLSTRMCGAHRAEILERVRARLQRGERILLVSTQLVEAGVDLDFPVVFRALAPADSLLQAAGRCNREGRLPSPGRVVVFRPVDGGTPGALYDTAIAITAHHLDRVRPGRPFASQAFMSHYYEEFYRSLFATDSSDRSKGIDQSRTSLCFIGTAEKFEMIDDHMVGVVVTDYGTPDERDAVRQALADLRAEPSRALRATHRRLLSRYSAQVTRNWLTTANVAPLGPDLYEWVGEYHPETGVITDTPAGVTIW